MHELWRSRIYRNIFGGAIKANRKHEYVCGFRLNPYDEFTNSGFIVRRLLLFSVLFMFAFFALVMPATVAVTLYQHFSRLFCRPVPNVGDA